MFNGFFEINRSVIFMYVQHYGIIRQFVFFEGGLSSSFLLPREMGEIAGLRLLEGQYPG